MPKKTIRTRSQFETKIVTQLKALGVKFQYEPFRIPYTKPTSYYTPDIVLANGIIIEVKGLFAGADRAKHLYIQKQHPDIQIHFVFQKANKKLNKRSKTTYADWCTKHNFTFSEGTIPLEWINQRKVKTPNDK